MSTIDDADPTRDGGRAGWIESIDAFLTADEPPLTYIFPELLPADVIMLLHGEPRAKKSLAAFELALSAATGTAPFGLTRFKPTAPTAVLYIMEEDSRRPTRERLRPIVDARCGDVRPPGLHVIVRKGVSLDDPECVTWLILALRALGCRLLVLDAARRLSEKTDEGPTKVRALMAVLRSIVTGAGVTLVVVHHDIKPPMTGQDQRRRSQRASGGDWFAGAEVPVHVEFLSRTESLVYPQDFKFGDDPAPFTFALEIEHGVVTRLIGTDTTVDQAETAGIAGKLLAWLRTHGPASKSAMQKAGLGRWDAIKSTLERLQKAGRVDAGPGRKAGSLLYWVLNDPSAGNAKGSDEVPFRSC